ncbi:MAG: very short patch repair endonuclease [Candidatus Cryptobacteroides sp.]
MGNWSAMADRMTKEQRHKCMASIRSKDTNPELAVRRALHARGFRFRLHARMLPGSPDIVLPKWHTVIQVNGCFWHGHNGCVHSRIPQTNSEFWRSKIERNRRRDEITYAHLTALGWRVITVWECSLKGDRQAFFDGLENEIRRNAADFDREASWRRKSREEYRRAREEMLLRQKKLEAEVDALYPISPKIRKLSQKEDY